jgi:hypothetical protein
MELLYQNKYGACYKIYDAPNPSCELQLIVDCIGIFMTVADLENLLQLVRTPGKTCYCADCDGAPCTKIWSVGPLHELYLKASEPVRNELEDLILGTQFVLNMDQTLDQFRIN